MNPFSFVIKVFILSVLVIFALQIEFKQQTLEDHFRAFLAESRVSAELHKVAQGARELSSDGWGQVKQLIATTTADSQESDRQNKSESETTRKASTFRWQGE